MSELVREAPREYERENWWAQTNVYGQAKAQQRGLTESDVEQQVANLRRERRARKASEPHE